MTHLYTGGWLGRLSMRVKPGLIILTHLFTGGWLGRLSMRVKPGLIILGILLLSAGTSSLSFQNFCTICVNSPEPEFLNIL
jgi:hypothetical protein